MPSSPPSDPLLDASLRLIAASYHQFTGKLLIESEPLSIEELRVALWDAPRAIVAHGIEADPIFFYGNRFALRLFEMDFADFTRLPSRLSAEPLAQDARAHLLHKVAQQGYVAGYSGLRIAGSGSRFMISDATIWNLLDSDGVCRGQAAVFISP